jgi:hypothetical protein
LSHPGEQKNQHDLGDFLETYRAVFFYVQRKHLGQTSTGALYYYFIQFCHSIEISYNFKMTLCAFIEGKSCSKLKVVKKSYWGGGAVKVFAFNFFLLLLLLGTCNILYGNIS